MVAHGRLSVLGLTLKQTAVAEDTVAMLASQLGLFDRASVSSQFRRGSRIHTDRFPERAPKAQHSTGVSGHARPENFLGVSIFQTGY